MVLSIIMYTLPTHSMTLQKGLTQQIFTKRDDLIYDSMRKGMIQNDKLRKGNGIENTLAQFYIRSSPGFYTNLGLG